MSKFQNIEILRDHEFLALLGIVELLRKPGQLCTIINMAFEEYKEKCRKYGLTPHNKSSFRRHLTRLIQLDFITSSHIKNRRFLEISLSENNSDKFLKKLKSLKCFS